MADYEARVRAVLEPGTFDADIKALLSKDYKLKLNFADNFSSQLADLERKLRSLENIKIDPFGASGSGGHSLNSSLNPINLKNSANAIANMQRTLRSFNFDNSAINAITKNINDMQLAVKNVRTEMQGKSVRITVTGTDELQRTVTVIKQLDSATNTLKTLKTSINQTFGIEDMTGRVNNSTQSFKELQTLLRDIGNIQFKIKGLDVNTDANRIAELTGQLHDLQAQYQNLINTTSNSLTDSQRSSLDKIQSKISNRLAEADAGLADKRANSANKEQIEQITKAYDELKSIQSEMANTQIKIAGLDTSKDAAQINELTTQLDALKQKYNDLYTSSGIGNGNTPELAAGLSASLQENQARVDAYVANLTAKLEDAKRKASEGIQLKIDAGEFDASISKVESQFGRLGQASQTKFASIKTDIEELKHLQTEMANTSDMDTRIKAYDQFEQTLRKVKNSLAQIPNEEKKMATSLQAAQLKNQMSTWLSNNSKAAQNYGSAIQGLISKVDQLNASGQLTAAEAQRIKTEFLGIKMEATAAGEVGRSFSDSLIRSLKAITGVFDITSAIRLGIRYIKQMAQEVIKVDTAMTQLKIVTNASSSEYQQFYKDSVQASKEIGSVVSDLIDSTTVYARLGYSMDESSALAKYTGMLQNVGDIDVSSAQDAITAITKAFDVNVSEIESVMDKLVIVGNNTPISVSQLAEGLNNAGSQLAAAGNNFEKSVALLTAANTTIQNVSKSSTGLRTITARLRKTKTELDELGEAMTDADYEAMVGALTGNGITLKNANGDFRDTYDILQDISKVWGKMTKMDQAALAEKLAGKLVPVRIEMCA